MNGGSHIELVLKRIAAGLVDWCIEFGGGLLGSYMGIMLAALVTALRDGSAETMESSMWNGLGYGFVFWAMSISFMNRVVIQGISRASIGKKIFKLELISVGRPLDWSKMSQRWILSHASLALGGLGYAYMFLDREARALHDLVARTDVVPLVESKVFSMEHVEVEPVAMDAFTAREISRVMILSSAHAERPSATIIQLPVRRNQEREKAAALSTEHSGATVIQLNAVQPSDKKAA